MQKCHGYTSMTIFLCPMRKDFPQVMSISLLNELCSPSFSSPLFCICNLVQGDKQKIGVERGCPGELPRKEEGARATQSI